MTPETEKIITEISEHIYFEIGVTTWKHYETMQMAVKLMEKAGLSVKALPSWRVHRQP